MQILWQVDKGANVRVRQISLHLKSSVLADEFEIGFMESVETQFEEVLVKEEGAGEQGRGFFG